MIYIGTFQIAATVEERVDDIRYNNEDRLFI
jgi:hypothetical protein